ncbi:MAG: ATP-binding protein [Oscillospiraceae bacterium]|nr:ATP-binding protein [Oscillospiraceae bacterium]
MSIRKRILIPMVALTIVCCVAVLLGSILLYANELNETLHRETDVAVNVAQREIEDLKIRARIAAIGMSTNPVLIEAILNNDLEGVEAVANALKNITQLDFCTILDKTGIVLIRTHATDRRGDSLAELSHIKSALEGKIESHIVVGATIKLGVMAGVPIYDDDMNIAGVVSLGYRLDIQDFAYRIKDLTDCEVAVYTGGESISTTILDADAVYALENNAPADISERVLAGETVLERFMLFGREMLAKYVPLYGVNDEIVGMLFVGHYTADELTKIVLFIASGALITLGVVALCIVVAIFISRFVERRLAGMMDSLRDTSLELENALTKANAASRAKSDFLSNMSHEMRTPLNAIIGMTLIGKKTKEAEGKVHALNKIGDASSHLLGTVNDILDMAKIEADKLELSYVEFNFEHMLDKVLNVIHFRADEKQHILTVCIDQAIPRYIVGDDQRLAQVITNLLSNAVKFTPEGGKVNLDVSWVTKDDNNCELRVEVTDSGIGISPEQQDKLFVAFEQATVGTSREYGGTGLGLSITRRIVELMGGQIWVKSELNKGSQFIITVKVKPGSKMENDELIETYDHYSFSGKRLLVAEDIEINREILIALLEDTGIIIDCVENGREALDILTDDPYKYDIVFMDLQMPQMGGLEATRLIRGSDKSSLQQIPIIAMTANVFKDDINACLDAGMNDHLGKPLDLDRMLEILRKYLIK